MKRCPQCNSVFDDSLVYCTSDGTPLVAETFVLPSEVSPLEAEEETVVHHDPIRIEIHHQTAAAGPPEQLNYGAPPPAAETIVVEKPRQTGKYLLFLAVGLVLGGGLVLAAVLFSIYLSQRGDAPNVATANSNAPAAATPSRTPTATPLTASAKHQKRTDAPDDDFNGRVISRNAYVRAQPSRGASETDVLPVDDRLEIEERENENSPWYRVVCEHGTAGWMHGNTIEYTKSEFDFGF